MAEGLRVGESVSVEVVRASPFQNVGFPPDYFFIVLGLIIAGAFIFFAVKRSRKAGMPSSGVNRKRRIFNAVLVSAAFGFLTFMFSGRDESWILAVLVFYSEYFVRGRRL